MTRGRILLLEAALVVAWSSGFIGAQLAAESAPVLLVLFWRFLLVALLLSPFVWRACRQGLGWRQLLLHLCLGSLAMFGFLVSGTKGIEMGVAAGTSALLCALQPLATAAFAGPVLGEAVSRRQWLGLALGFLGVLLAVGGAPGEAPIAAYLLSLLGVLCMVAATLIAKRAPPTTGLLPALGIQSAATTLLLLPLVLIEGSPAPLPDWRFVTSVGWFILFSTFGGFGLYWLCLRLSSASRVGSLIYLTPPVTMIWAWLMFGTPLAPEAGLGFLVCLLGVWLAQRRRLPPQLASEASSGR